MTTLRQHPTSTGGAPRRIPLSTFWAKTLMAVSGLVFAAFVTVHMIGNLKVYQGREHFDAYAHWLREAFAPLLPYEGLLWAMRVVLLACLVVHVGCAFLLARRARVARGAHRRRIDLRSFTGRTMLVSGIVLLAFVVFHVLDLTAGVQPAAAAGFAPGSAYDNLVASFQRPLVSAFYILAMLVLAAHLWHGLWTAAHDLGATGRRLRAVAAWVALGLAVLVMLGNVSIPVAVLSGVIR